MRTHYFKSVEEIADLTDLARRITNVVICENDLLRRGEIHAGVNAVHLVVEITERSIDRLVAADVAPDFRVF